MSTVGLWRRAIAVAIDALASLFVVLLGFGFGALDPVVFRPEPGWFWTEWWLKHWLDNHSVFVRPIVAWVAVGVVWTTAWELGAGRSPGCRVAGIEVVDVDCDNPDPGRILLRSAGLLISAATLGLGWLVAFASPTRRALHDVLSGTYMVRHRK